MPLRLPMKRSSKNPEQTDEPKNKTRDDSTPKKKRARRPHLEREHPVRLPSGVVRSETPAEHSVDIAYKVFDEYLEEGRRFAAGQSAWNNELGGLPTGMTNAVSNGANILGTLGRVAGDLTRLAQQLGLPGLTQSKGPPFENPTYFHPQQDPNYPIPDSASLNKSYIKEQSRQSSEWKQIPLRPPPQDPRPDLKGPDKPMFPNIHPESIPSEEPLPDFPAPPLGTPKLFPEDEQQSDIPIPRLLNIFSPFGPVD